MIRKLFWLGLFIASSVAFPQNPQTQTAPLYATNAKYTNGVAPGYMPCANGAVSCASTSGLTLSIGPGTANCSGTIETYAGGSLTMTASTTNYVYLNTSASCAPAVKTSAFASGDIPIATVVAGASAITSIVDDRTMFTTPGNSGAAVSAIIPGTNTTCTPETDGQCTGTVTVNSTAPGGINQLTGDGTAGPGTGSQVLVLATVNGAPGSCGDSTHVCAVTTNAKGLVTSQSAVAINSGSSVVDILSPDRPTGTTSYYKNEYIALANGATQTVFNIQTLTVSAWSITSNVPTFTTSSNVALPGQTYTLSGFGTSTFFNGLSCTTVANGLSSTSVTMYCPGFSHANGSSAESGAATPSGYVDSLTIITLNGGTGGSGTDAVLNIYYNGSSTATVSVPMSILCQSIYDNIGNFFTNYGVTFTSSSVYQPTCVLKLPIPFSSGLKITYVNNLDSTTFWSETEVQTGVPDTWPYTRKLHIDYFYGAALTPYAPEQFTSYAGGPGRLVAVWWLYDGFPGTVDPAPTPLEGNFRYYPDAATATWEPSTAYSVGNTFVDSNGNIETVSTAGTSGSSQPSWNTFLGTTTDGSVVWTESPGDPPNIWRPSASYALVNVTSILDSNGNTETLSTAGTSGSSQPSWNGTVGGTTTDGSAVWTNTGSSYASSGFQSSGTEDFFRLGNYFGAKCGSQINGGANTGNIDQLCAGWGDPFIGMTYVGVNNGQTEGAYRYFINDKRYFNEGFSILWQDGDSSEETFTGNPRVWATLYYYTQN